MISNLPINWFDFAVVAVIIIGGVIGRKRGMSEELLPVLQWLAIIGVAAMAYEPLGRYVAGYTQMTLLWSYVFTYLLLALAIRLIFGWVKSLVGEKLVGSDLFGRAEYYLGCLAGSARFACILLAAMALVHSRYYSPQERAAEARMQRDNFGSISFPTPGLIQASIFSESSSGRFVEKYLSQQLIASTPSGAYVIHRVGIGKRRERAVDEALGERR